MSACPITGTVTYNISYSVNGGPVIVGNQFDCIGYTGINTVLFFVDNGACIQEFMTSINCTGVGLQEVGPGTVHLYPNPVSGTLHISLSGNSIPSQVNITDMAGRLIQSMTPNMVSGEISLETEGMSKGIYLLRLDFEDGSVPVIGRFVKD